VSLLHGDTQKVVEGTQVLLGKLSIEGCSDRPQLGGRVHQCRGGAKRGGGDMIVVDVDGYPLCLEE
jgi:hypothetical protein